jgi:N-acetylglutamate synthase-like GNAT family acetyltransferase
MAPYRNQQLIGIGGLSADPSTKKDMATLRRVYVRASSRRRHVGQALIKALVIYAPLRSQSVRLFADTAGGDGFYLRWDFMRQIVTMLPT